MLLSVEAWFQCPRPQGPDRARVLGCPVRFGAPETRFVLRRRLLEQPLPRSHAGLFDYLERHASTVLARLPTDGRISIRVRRLITEGYASVNQARRRSARSSRSRSKSFAVVARAAQRTRHRLSARRPGFRIAIGSEDSLPLSVVQHVTDECRVRHGCWERCHAADPDCSAYEAGMRP